MLNSINVKGKDLRKASKKYMMEIILIVLVIVLALFVKGFIRLENLMGILRNVAITGVIAFGMTMTIIGGEIDLSVGSTIAISAVVTATMTGVISDAKILPMDYAVIVAMIITLVMGVAFGLLNGFIRTFFNVPSFIITLAMLNVLYGLSAIISKGFPITTLPIWYNYIGAGMVGPIPFPAILLLLIFAVTLIIMNYTRFGREVYAVGGNPEAARLSGINVNKVKIIILVVVQLMASFAGIILSALVMSGSSTFGKGYEMDVISAVIIGGASLNGGIGKVWGTLIGILFLGILMNAMTLLGVDDYVKYVVRGLMILIAVLINTVQLQSMSKATK